MAFRWTKDPLPVTLGLAKAGLDIETLATHYCTLVRADTATISTLSLIPARWQLLFDLFSKQTIMIYTNDETDKSVRQKNFYLTVYALPIGLTLGICGLIYLATTTNYLPKGDAIYGCVLSLTPGLFLFAYNKKNWLKMPDGTYHNIKGLAPTNKFNVSEPTEYEAEYFYSKKEKITSTLTGLALIGVGIWLQLKGSKSILIPIGTSVMGIFLSYVGIKGLLDKSPKLKLAKTGLWTTKLGFVDWNDIAKAQVIEDTSGKTPQTILEIYLKGTVFAEANQPDEMLYLTDIDDKQYVEMVVDNLKSKRNELTT